MFDDPYRVLGLTPDATDEEVKQAYRRLAKKYHPDMNPGDPEAAKKMNEINAAYDQIKNPPQHNYQPGYDPFSGWQYQETRQDGSPSALQAARHFVRYGQFDSALNALKEIPELQRNAEWYYLSGVANSRLGNRVVGIQHMQKAVELEPDNILYRRALEQLQHNGSVYDETRRTVFGGYSANACDCCYACAAINFCLGSPLGWIFCC